MFKDKTIRNRVMAHINAKITAAQDKYEDGVNTLNVKCEDLQKRAEQERDDEIVILENKLVNDIIGKFL
jgi:hypothetical protein